MSESQKADFSTPDISRREGMPLFHCINSLDPRLAVTNSIPFAIQRSGSNVTSYKLRAASATTSGCSFTLNVPTLSTVIDRHVFISTKVQLSVSYVPAATKFIFGGTTGGIANLGKTWSMAPFPFHSLCQNINMTINNTSINMNTSDFLPALMKILDEDVLEEHSSVCPTKQDYYLNYSAGLNAGSSTAHNVLGSAENWSGTGIPPRGCYNVNVINNGGAGDGTAVKTAIVELDIYEPLLASPWLVGNKSANQQGLYGIQTILFQMNFLNNTTRALRAYLAAADVSATVTPNPVTCQITSIDQDNTFLHFTMITPPVGSKYSLPARNIVPYMDAYVQKSNMSGAVINGAQTQLTSNTYTMHQIPDRVLVFAKKKPTKMRHR